MSTIINTNSLNAKSGASNIARDYDTTVGSIKTKFNEIDGQISAYQTRISSAEEDIMMIAATGVCTDDNDSDHDDKTIILNNTIVTPLQDGQRLTVIFTKGLSALPESGNVRFTVDNGTTYYDFLPNGIDTCCEYAFFKGALFADPGFPIEVEFDDNRQCWKLVDSAYAYNSMQAYRVGIDYDEEKLIKMDSLINYAKYYDGRALTPTDQNQFEWETPSNETVGILRYKGSATEVIIPPFYYLNGNTYRVTGLIGKQVEENILQGVFDSNNNIETVVLPNTITTIGQGAFCMCSNLTTVNIPKSVETIDISAFEQEPTIGSALSSIIIPDNVTSIGDYAFNNCNNLENIIVFSISTNIGTNVFNNHSNNLIISCYQDSDIKEYATTNTIPVEYLDDVITYDTTTVTINPIKNGKEYRCLNTDLASLTVNLPTMDTTTTTNIKTKFDSLVTFYCGSSSFNFSGTYPSTGEDPQFIQYFGKDCDDGVFQPNEENYVYNLAYWWNGKMYVCTVV